MRKEWDFDAKGRFMTKERNYLASEQRLKDEKAALTSQVEASKQSLDDMKYVTRSRARRNVADVMRRRQLLRLK